MPTYEVMVEMIVPAQQVLKINARNEAEALSMAREQMVPEAMSVTADRRTWSIRQSRVKKLSSVIVPIADD